MTARLAVAELTGSRRVSREHHQSAALGAAGTAPEGNRAEQYLVPRPRRP